MPPHAGITFDSCETPSAPSLPDPRSTVCTLSKPLPGVDGMPRAPKTYSPRASTSDSCETLLTPRIWLLLGGFRSYQMCWFWAVCGFWSPSWLETAMITQLSGLLSGVQACKLVRNPPVLPIATNQKLRCIFDSVQTASRRAGNTARRGVCTLSDVRFFGLCVGPPRSSVIAGLISAKPGLKRLRRLGAEGFRSYQM